MNETNTEKQVCEIVATYGERTTFEGERVRSSRDLDRFVRKVIPNAPQERMVAVSFDAKMRPTGWWTIGVGGLSACPIEPGAVFRPAILTGAARIALVHNHPSGDSTPSPDDIALTARLRDAGDLLGIDVVDHVITTHTDDGYFSFLDAGLIGGAK